MLWSNSLADGKASYTVLMPHHIIACPSSAPQLLHHAGDRIDVTGFDYIYYNRTLVVVSVVIREASKEQDFVVGNNIVALTSITYLITTCGLSPPMNKAVSAAP